MLFGRDKLIAFGLYLKCDPLHELAKDVLGRSVIFKTRNEAEQFLINSVWRGKMAVKETRTFLKTAGDPKKLSTKYYDKRVALQHELL